MTATVTKQVMLFIVEGPTEETALGNVFQSVFDTARVKFDVVHGDLTAQEHSKEPRERVRELVLYELQKDRGYRWEDIMSIVQICDSDGAFIPDDRVVEGSSGVFEYLQDCIRTDAESAARRRNHDKSRSMRQLAGIAYLTYRQHRVPYRLCFFSRNMEHALHNELGNLSNEEKVHLAHRFRRRFAKRPVEFKTFLNDPAVAVPGTFAQTWQWLENGVSSLHRGSNLRFALPD